MSPMPAPTLAPGQEVDGFRVVSVTPLPSIRAVAYMIDHPQSGARLLHLHGDDSENLFSINFATPVADDTGVPHILEHAVLGGSKKFPVKEPFFEMVKMSMATFINAMTSIASTVYPVASTVKRDFYNLAEVYFDAVFHPLITRDTFRREGHHFALKDNADPKSDLILKGIVYNEMKGVYSNPESLVWRHGVRKAFPDTPLSRDSGGDPRYIPELTYEEFRKFHETYYHPSNARIFIYGDIPTREHLAFLKDRLADFVAQPRPASTVIPRQPRWKQPREAKFTFPIGAQEKTAEKSFISLAWLVGDTLDPAESMDWSVLDRLLLGNEAAPLKKAIIESRLGADLFAAGAGSFSHEGYFHVGLRASEPDRAQPFLKLVLETLARIADEGFTPEQIDTAFQQLSYHHLEIQSQFPLKLMWGALHNWMHEANPLTFLQMDKHLADCRERVKEDPALFTRMIRIRLLDNSHRLLVTGAPDPAQQAREEQEATERLRAMKATFSESQLREIGESAAALEAAQGKPNPPEALALLPQLKASDLPRKPRHIPTTSETLPIPGAAANASRGVTLLRNDVFSNGVNYLHLDFDLSGLPADLYPYLPRYDEAFAKLGAAGQPYTALARRKAASTGGVGVWASFYSHVADPSRPLRRMRMTLKTLDGQMEKALGVLEDLLFALDPRDKTRLKDVVVQSRAHARTGLANNGSGTALRYASRGFSAEAALNEEVSGLPELAQLNRLADHFDEEADGLIERIERIRDFLLNPHRLAASFTGSDDSFAVLRRTLESWIARMKPAPVLDFAPSFTPYDKPPRVGLAAPMTVAYCAMVMPAPHYSHPDSPLLDLATRFMSLDYVLTEVRFKGNAYGAGCFYNGSDRTFGFHSYRDPRLNETLAVYRGLREYVEKSNWTQADIDRAIIGSAKHAEGPIRPADATGTALSRWIAGNTNAMREARYAAMLAATPASVKRVLLEQLDRYSSRAAICVVSSREKLEAANRERPTDPLAIEEIIKP